MLELRPKVDWNKGSAVNWILDALDLGARDDVFPIYLGDDITDEDAFVAMESRCADLVQEPAKDVYCASYLLTKQHFFVMRFSLFRNPHQYDVR